MLFEIILRLVFLFSISFMFLLFWIYIELTHRGKYYGFNQGWEMIYDFITCIEKDKQLKRKSYIVILSVFLVNPLVFIISL